MILLDTYDLGNGNIAQLIESDSELSCGVSVEPKYAIDIMNGVMMMSAIPFQANPLDAIFILMDLGLVEPDYPNPKFEPLGYLESVERVNKYFNKIRK